MTPCAELPLPLASTSPWLKVQENTTNFLHGYKLFFCCRLSRLCALSGQKLRTQQIFNRHLLNGKFHMELPSNLTGSQFPRSIYPNEEKMDTDQFRCFFFFSFCRTISILPAWNVSKHSKSHSDAASDESKLDQACLFFPLPKWFLYQNLMEIDINLISKRWRWKEDSGKGRV